MHISFYWTPAEQMSQNTPLTKKPYQQEFSKVI